MAEKEEMVGRSSPPAEAKGKAPDTDVLVNDWFLHYFPNSPIARSDEAWRLLNRAVADLKQRLKGA